MSIVMFFALISEVKRTMQPGIRRAEVLNLLKIERDEL